MKPSDDELASLFAWWRESARKLNDQGSVHFCELALARLARHQGSALAVDALMSPLRRMAASGTIHGIDILATELILASISADAETLRQDVQAMLMQSGRVDAVERTIAQLLESADAVPDEQVVSVALAALDLSVAIGHFAAGATAMEALAAYHQARDETAPSVLCLRQAAAYRELDGDTAAATALRAAARECSRAAGDATPACIEDAEALERTGAHAEAIQVRLAVARQQQEAGDHQAAVRTLRGAMAMAHGQDSPEDQAVVHRQLAVCYEALGDAAQATSHAVKAELLAPPDDL